MCTGERMRGRGGRAEGWGEIEYRGEKEKGEIGREGIQGNMGDMERGDMERRNIRR